MTCSWGWEGSVELPPGASTVHITLEPTDRGTQVTLVHEGLTAGRAASHGEGSDHYLGGWLRLAPTVTPGPTTGMPDRASLGCCSGRGKPGGLQVVLRGINETDYDRRVRSCRTSPWRNWPTTFGVAFFGTTAGADMPEPHPVGAGKPIETRIADPAQVALEAWNARGTNGTIRVRGDDMPASIAVGILSVELLVHAWDFAVASGQPVIVSDQVAAQVLDAAHTIITPQIRPDRFADELHARANAGVLGQLIGSLDGAPSREIHAELIRCRQVHPATVGAAITAPPLVCLRLRRRVARAATDRRGPMSSAVQPYAPRPRLGRYGSRVIVAVLSAPGAGKTAVTGPLAGLLPGHAVLDWDAFMDPAGALAGRPIRTSPRTWPAYRDLVRGVLAPRLVVLLGVCTPGELSDWPISAWVLLDCADQERRRRLGSAAGPATSTAPSPTRATTGLSACPSSTPPAEHRPRSPQPWPYSREAPSLLTDGSRTCGRRG